MAFPLVILALAVVSIFGTGTHNVILAITIPFIPRCARVVRSSALAVRETPYHRCGARLRLQPHPHRAAPHGAERDGALPRS